MLLSGHHVLTSAGWKKDMTVCIENGRIISIYPGLTDTPYEYLTSGLIDMHVHGGQGYNTETEDMEGLKRFLLWEAQNGVTDVLLTVSTASLKIYRECIPFIRKAIAMQKEGKLPGAVIQGIHLEGPFLSSNRLGAMVPDAIMRASVDNLLAITGGSLDDIRLVSIAPEIEGAEEVIRYLAEHGVCVQAGHTDASFEEAKQGFAWGIDSLCHAFNACHPIHHRDPGVVTAALTDPDVYCETICDMNHLHPGTIAMIQRCKGREKMCIISDTIWTTCLPDGVYHTELGKDIIVKNGVMRISNGSLDGGVCTIGQSMSRLIEKGFEAEDVLYSASVSPSNRLRLSNMGTLDAGRVAHVSAWNEKLEIQQTRIGDTRY